MSGYQWAALGIVVLVALLVFGLGWHACAWYRDRAAELAHDRFEQTLRGSRVYADEMQQLSEQRAPMPTYRGWIEGSALEGWQPAPICDVFTARQEEIGNAADQIATLRAEMWAEQWRREIPR